MTHRAFVMQASSRVGVFGSDLRDVGVEPSDIDGDGDVEPSAIESDGGMDGGGTGICSEMDVVVGRATANKET